MLSRHILTLVLGAGAGAAVALLITRREQEGLPAEQVHHALKYGAPSSENLRFFKNFVVSYESRLRNPRWVLEHITAQQTQGDGNRKNVEFYEDKGLDARFRSRLADFKDSGYDRGHMAPAANHKESADTMLETFGLSNICPQVGRGFNRDYWARFERFVSLLTRTSDDVYIVTGPLYLPSKTPLGYMMQHPMIGLPPRMVAVPTHFFKVVLAERASGGAEGDQQVALGAFVLPNAPVQPDTPLTAFSVPVESLEEAAGLEFFPGYLSAERRASDDRAAIEYQSLGRQQMRAKALSAPTAEFLLERPTPALNLLPSGEDAAASSAVPAAEQDVQLLEPMAEAHLTAPAGAPFDEQHSRNDAEAGREAVAAAIAALDVEPVNGKRPRRRKAKVKGSEFEAAPLTGSRGRLLHVCQLTECKLPAEDWYMHSKVRKT
ncbi:hypothetical protein CVIRNUC_006250 [Coccomyxa viridis]|uniref:Endonuclease n=1 Tax=Coccomyxa viridis TaxID=1274662 RepID=A0AAV1I965_9CHLO|nr:hypothetical protein CVIRNUC_006250 [Coccomyxa viridis]